MSAMNFRRASITGCMQIVVLQRKLRIGMSLRPKMLNMGIVTLYRPAAVATAVVLLNQ